MKMLIISGCVVLYFVLGGIMSSIVMHYTDSSLEEDPVPIMLMLVLWPALTFVVFGAIGITIGDKIFDAIKNSREKHSV